MLLTLALCVTMSRPDVVTNEATERIQLINTTDYYEVGANDYVELPSPESSGSDGLPDAAELTPYPPELDACTSGSTDET
jgi:hypothetical protein